MAVMTSERRAIPATRRAMQATIAAKCKDEWPDERIGHLCMERKLSGKIGLIHKQEED